MASGYIDLPVEGGGGGTGNILSINGSTAANQFIVDGTNIDVVSGGGTTTINFTGVLPIANGGTGQNNQQAALNNLTDSASHSDGDVLQIVAGNAVFAPGTGGSGTPLTFAGFDALAVLSSVTGWSFSDTGLVGSSNANLTYNPNNTSISVQGFNWNVNIEPLQDSPNDTATIHQIFANLDNGPVGFDFGDSGNSVTMLNLGYNFNGNGSVYGSTAYINMSANIGNGTDPVTLKGHNFINGSLNVGANATIDGGIFGYNFQPSLNAASITTTNTGVTAFTDASNLPVTITSYISANLTPTIGTIGNNSGYTGINLNPVISNFAGNANANVISVNGSFSNFGSGGFSGINLNPNLNVITNNNTMIQIGGQSASGAGTWTGIQISDNAINTSGSVRGLQIQVDPANSAIESQGHHALQSQNDLVSSLGQINGNIVGGSLIVPDATAITGTDAFGNNFAFTIDLGDATSSYISASGLVGLTNVGFVGQIAGDGTADLLNFCLAGYQATHTGAINRVNNFYAAAIPTGSGGTIDESVLFLGNYPFGPVATDHWGIRIEDTVSPTVAIQNYLPRLALGDVTNKKTVDGTVVLNEIDVTTPAFSEYNNYRSNQTIHYTASTTVSNGNYVGIIDLEVDTGVTIGAGAFAFSSTINRQSATDEGTCGALVGTYNLFQQGGVAKITPIYAGFLTGSHTVSDGTVADMYDFWSMASSLSPGTVTNRWGIVLEADSGYDKKNWFSGFVSLGGSSLVAPTRAAEVQGDLAVITEGSGLQIKEGANAKMGTAVLVGGTVTVTTTAVTANSRIFVSNNLLGGTPGALYTGAVVAGTSFDITSTSALDTSTISWMLVEPA